MPTQKTDYLVQLINALTKAEKRSFRLFVTRNQSSDDILFLKLFDEISRSGEFNETHVLSRIPGIKKRQLSNLKAHLYKQLLICLRMLNRSGNPDIEIRERIDYAHVLYDKGLYRQSLDVLSKTKTRAIRENRFVLALDIVEFEKFIETQYITLSIENRAEELKNEARFLEQKISKSQTFSNLAIQLYGLYLKVGHVKSEHDYQYLKNFFYSNLPSYEIEQLNFYQKLYMFQSYMWFHYMNQDFANYYKYCKRWYDLFEEFPEMIRLETPLYLKSIHNVLTALFMSYRYSRFLEMWSILNDIPSRGLIVTRNEEGLFQMYRFIHLINKHFLKGTFSEGSKLMRELSEVLEENPYNWDSHRILVFYYKLACMYFGSGDWDSSITYLNKIINSKTYNLRADIQSFARILNLIAHYELGNQQLLEYQIKSVYRYLAKTKELQSIQNEIFRFLRKTPSMFKSDMKAIFSDLREKLLKLSTNPYERRAFLYLDIISWLESKIQDKPVEMIIQEKFKKKVHVLAPD